MWRGIWRRTKILVAKFKLLFLHGLPFDNSMWTGQLDLLPGDTLAPNLYSFGDSIEGWAARCLQLVRGNRLVVVGCSVGGSCALEIASIAPERIAALVLIGTKAVHRPDPALHMSVVESLQHHGLQYAWERHWTPLFSKSAAPEVIQAGLDIVLLQSLSDILRGVSVFHMRQSRDDVLLRLNVPIHFVSGDEDVAPGPKVSEMQAELAQNGRCHLIRNCGHFVPMEQPEAFNAILRDVISDTRARNGVA
jgi:pimeloyl-ACP methyl ester carboxylesterase